MLFSSVFSLFALAAGVSAHGYVKSIVLDGKTYKGPVAGGAKIASPIRQISTTSPWKGVTGAGMTCGRDAKAASIVAPVTAGSTVSLKWEDHPGDTWNHDMGPLIEYMAKVPEGQTADKVNPANLDWFKIAQVGQDGKKWVQAKLMTDQSHTFKIPAGIQNGHYILRHEIVALHLADKKGGAEFYTSCIQVNVKGGSSAKVSTTPTVKFPGGYSASEAGIFTPNVFNNGFKYTFPGPAIAKIGGGSTVKANANNSTTPTNNSGKTTTTKASTSTGKPSATGKTSSNTGSVKSKCRRAIAGWTSRMQKRVAPAPVSE
jgi:hypothetical protein